MTKAEEFDFYALWYLDGKYLDPDTSDVDWFDKRKELAMYAFEAGLKNSEKRKKQHAKTDHRRGIDHQDRHADR